MTSMTRWSSGTGKVLEVGDLVKIDASTARYRITSIRQTATGVEVSAYGGKKGRMGERVFRPEALTKVRDQDPKKDPQRVWREAIHETAEASKNRRRGARR